MLYESKQGWAKYVIAGWAFLECLFFAGVLYGWSSLVFIYKDEGIYFDLCSGNLPPISSGNSTNVSTIYFGNIRNDSEKFVYTVEQNSNEIDIENVTSNENRTVDDRSVVRQCGAQDSRLSLCFTISSSIFCISCIVMGHVNFKLGTRNTRLISFGIFTTGSVCMAFVSKGLPWLMFPGLTLIGVGGLPVFVANNQVANLFTKGSSSVVGLLCGGYDMSVAMFLMIKIAYQHGFSRKNMFLILAGVHCLSLISTFKFMPKDFIHKKQFEEALEMKHEIIVSEQDVHMKEKKPMVKRRMSIADIQPLSSYLRQPLFITQGVWLCLLQLRFYYFIGTLNTFLNRILNEDTAQVSYFTNVCFYTMMGGLVTSFLVGIVYDGQKLLFKNGATKLYRSLMPALLPLTLACVSAILMSVLVLVPTPTVLYVTFISMTFYRSFMYSMCAAFIVAIFPSRYFAVLYGLTMVAGGIFSLFQYALFSWAEAYFNAPFHVDIFLLFVTVLSLGHPVYMWYCGWREEYSTNTQL